MLGLFIIFPSALAVSQIVQKPGIKIIVLILIGLNTFYYTSKQRQISPMDRYFSLIKNINFKKNALITSDYNKFVYLKQGISFLFIFNGLDENINEARKFILKNLNEKKRVFIDSSGLRSPYYQFDGSFYHPLSLGKIGQSQAKEVLKDFDFQLYKSDPINKEIYFFEIKKTNIKKRTIKPRIVYPSYDNYYKINSNKSCFLDPFVNLFYFLFRKKDPDFWWYELKTN